jgi:hypothetical protein
MNAEIDDYESHEAWLARQLVELEQMADLPHEPPPRVLPPLPWWKDAHRVNGEAERILEALRFAWEVIKAVLRGMLRGFFRNAAAVTVLVALVLFLTGWLLSTL